MTTQFLPRPPETGEIVRVRQRQYLVEDVQPPSAPGEATLVCMSCLDDDAQGEPLEVLWEHELDTEIVRASWEKLGRREFDAPSRFAAYLHTLRWNCVTATTPRLFQAPWRAGIEVMAYQLEPLRKALRLPRVNLFIADDVGLGKTIEAGLVLREMLMRQRVRRVVVVAPPSVVIQWRDELEQRFGLPFVIYDRDYVARVRRERGYVVNPWTTHSRFILSHALLRDEDYAGPLRDLLSTDENGKPRDGADPGALLILDEAHHAAPASSSKYAIDSQFTRAVRDLAERFEHRLFLSATPHNGLSNSFSALLEILDPQRFVRGTPVEPQLRDEVMVRRLKSDLREVSGGFPVRRVVSIVLQDLPRDAPELELARLLDQYWEAREDRLKGLPAKQRAAQGLVLVNLQKRLFSSIEAFHRTLSAHRRALDRAVSEPSTSEASPAPATLDLLSSAPGAEDERAELDEDEVDAAEEQAVEAATQASGGKPSAKELALVARMAELAERTRRLPDARVRYLVDWIRKELCPDLPALGAAATQPARWLSRRVVIFTEYADTKRYLEQQLRAAVGATERGEERLATFHGGMPDELREEVKRAFNTDPDKHPLRILVATDAAREGVNLQNHCADLFHMDLPWNPSRLEQRSGRIDRKLQRAPEVRCHYFVYAQREADRVLEVLVERTKVIHEELGSMPPVLEERLTHRLAAGIGPRGRKELAEALRKDMAEPKAEGTPDELDGARERKTALSKQLDELRNILDQSRRSLDLNESQLNNVLCESLEMLGAEPLSKSGDAQDAFVVPALDKRAGADPTWAETLDTLRSPRPRGMKVWEWRRTVPIRPVVFKDPGHIDEEVVHLHLEHRLVQRLFGRFLAQGFVLDDLARACVGQTDDAVPRVVLLGRLSLYGDRAARLHDEIVPLAARWVEPATRSGALKPYAEDAQEKSWDLLLASLSKPKDIGVVREVQQKLLRAAPDDVTQLLPHLKARCDLLAEKARTKLTERGEREAKDMVDILEAQKKRIERELAKIEDPQLAFEFKDWNDDERRQLQDNAKFWRRRLDAIPRERVREPARIRTSYTVRATRIEPVGIAYLWPVTG
ncbi:DISARM system SNF2-like helicase DrmD [Sorangium sp. So ce341]|uniref:DISARM system SNF2-like helicase DrmD n=1 Tax=Sorangium sp. So ce341 TaxID=3133302 RepID=UPI003F61C554